MEIAERRKQIKETLRVTIEAMTREIEVKSSTFAVVDRGGNSTVSRRGQENITFKEYIERKVPFRPAISQVCTVALQMPIKVPRRIRKKIAGDTVPTTIEIALKQFTASLFFEAVDEALEWRSPLKAEPNYNGNSKKALLGEPVTRPKRFGSAVQPFGHGRRACWRPIWWWLSTGKSRLKPRMCLRRWRSSSRVIGQFQNK